MGLSGTFTDPNTGAIDQPLYVVVYGINLDHALKTAIIRANAYVSDEMYEQGKQSLRTMDQACSDTAVGVANIEPSTAYTDYFSSDALVAAAQEDPPIDVWLQAYRWLQTLELFANTQFDGKVH